jgi:hypothetical protein
MMKKHVFSKRFGIIISVLLLTIASNLPIFTALGAPLPRSTWCGTTPAFGRGGCMGYATNQDFFVNNASDPTAVYENYIIRDPGLGDAIPSSVNTAAALISTYLGYLARGNATTYEYDSFGAAVTMDMMMGATGQQVCQWYTGGVSTTCTWQAAVAYAMDPTHQADWEARINYYDTKGWIIWSTTLYQGLGIPSTGHNCSTWVNCWPGGYPSIAPSADAQDIAWSNTDPTGVGTFQMIEFNNPDGTQLRIDRHCSNMFGAMEGLAPASLPDQDMRPSLGTVVDSAGNPVSSFTPGGTYTINLSLANFGTATSEIAKLELRQANNTTMISMDNEAAPYGFGHQINRLPFFLCQVGYPFAYVVNSAGTPVCQDNHWSWRYNLIPGGYSSITQKATFQVSASASGSICFQADSIREHKSNPSDPANFSVSSVLCLPVGNIKYPSVQGLQSDIHAGGGACGSGLSGSGIINTHPSAGSFGDYVVSAVGSISNIGSNGSVGDPSLRMGSNGGYKEVCRPDLYAGAQANMPSGASWQGGGLKILDSSFAGAPDITMDGTKAVAYMTGPVTLHGNWTQNYPLTLVVNGSVTIDQDINVSFGPTDRNDMPSVGIIASGPIDIQTGATKVDAMLFSDSGIDTCFTAVHPVGLECDNSLTVYGFLMAPSILLHRLGS